MAKLWLINPRRKRRQKNARRRRIHSRRRRRVSSRRVIMVNPRRRRRIHRHRNPRRHHRARRRNPFLGGSLTQDVLMPAALGVAGGVALGMAWNALSPNLPSTLTGNSIGALVGEGVGAVGLGWLAAKALGREKGAAVAIGALTVVLYNFVEGAISGTGLPSFAGLGFHPLRKAIPRARTMGAYLPGQGLNPGGMGAYMPMGAISNFNPAPYVAGLGGTFDNPGLNDSMF
jgi:hypothetical protein